MGRVSGMWNGKKKAIAFSFDDGVTQEERWVCFENLCKMLSGKVDVFYGTNSETLL